MTKHSHEKAIDEQTFDRLYEASGELAHPFDAECAFVLVATGRLGMRAGEVCHLRESWVNWQKNMIEIPSFDPCDKGEDGGPCHYCQDMAQQSADHTGRELPRRRLGAGVAKDELSKRKAARRLDTSRATIGRAIDERPALYGL